MSKLGVLSFIFKLIMIKEEYRDISDEEFVPLECFDYLDKKFKGIYEINKLGWIKTVSSGNIRKDIKSIGGIYPLITLSSPDYRTTYSIHKLVALTFLEKEDGKPIIDHSLKIKRIEKYFRKSIFI